MTDFGSFQLTGVDKLPNVTVAFPGEHWSDGKAAESITPGELVVPINSGGKLFWQRAASGTIDPRAAVALKTVQTPDVNTGPGALGPNELMNAALAVNEYVHAYHSGDFHLTLIAADTYGPGDLIGWDPNAARQAGKTGTGAWKKVTQAAQALFSVQEFRTIPGSTTTGILTVRSLRGQF